MVRDSYVRWQLWFRSNPEVLTPRCTVLLEQLTGLQLVKKFPAISRNPKVHYRTHNRPPPVCILGQPNPVHIPTSHLLQIHPNIIHPFTPRSPQRSPSLRFPHQDPILTYSLHGAESQLTGLQPVKKFPAFQGTRRFITALTSVRHLSILG